MTVCVATIHHWSILCAFHGTSSHWTEQTSRLNVKSTCSTQPVALWDILNAVACLCTHYVCLYCCHHSVVLSMFESNGTEIIL